MSGQHRARALRIGAVCLLLVVLWNIEDLEFDGLIRKASNMSGSMLFDRWSKGGTQEVFHLSLQTERKVDEEADERPDEVDDKEGGEGLATPVVLDSFEDLIKSHRAAENLTREVLCQSWSDPALEKRLVSRCSYYLVGLEQWRKRAAEDPGGVVAWQQRSGSGDRLAGLVSTFHYAFTMQKRVVIKWRALDAVFEPSCFMRGILTIDGEEQATKPSSPKCTERSCPAARRVSDVCAAGEDLDLVDKSTVIRGCANSRRCRQIESFQGEAPTMVETAGCPMRLFFEPRASFLDSPVQYFYEGKVYDSTLRELAVFVREFQTIALHYRTGDGAMTKKHPNGVAETSLGYTKECMGWVDDFVAREGAKAGDSREVKWIVASDNENLREYFRKEYPSKTIILMSPPEHISKTKSDDLRHSTIGIFQEFYLLGLADELVVWQGKYRMSAFSKFAWLFNLKSRYYAIRYRMRSCLLKEMDYDGNTATFPSECAANKHMGVYTDFSLETHSWKYKFPASPLPQLHNPKRTPAL